MRPNDAPSNWQQSVLEIEPRTNVLKRYEHYQTGDGPSRYGFWFGKLRALALDLGSLPVKIYIDQKKM